jgi:hypothetical protein
MKDWRKYITFGASPRATINLTEGARPWPCCAGAPMPCPKT